MIQHFMHRLWISFVFALAPWAMACAAQTTQPQTTAPQTAPAQSKPASVQTGPADTTIPWSSLDDKTRGELSKLLDSPDWPIRVFALLRLERYSGAALEPLLHARLHDSAWQVRCFGIRQARRMNITLSSADFADEADPHVIRAALRFGVALPEVKVSEAANALLRTKGVEELMLGIEIAAACNIQTLRADAAKRAARLIKNMDNAIAVMLSRRLAVVLGLAQIPSTSEEWIAWLRTQHDELKLAKSDSQAGDALTAAAPLAAQMDDEQFARLLDYLGGLRARDLDLVIVMDATSSMIPMINQARAGVDSLILFLQDISREMRVAFIAYRDHDNKPVWDGHPFTTDIAAIRKYLYDLRITGGADYPEAVFEGLAACGELKWNRKATREAVLVGDAPPHEEDIYRIHALMESYRDLGIIVHAAHIPMEFPANYYNSLPPLKSLEARKWLEDYNKSTGQAFADIAQAGCGRKTEMAKADELVPSIMHFTIEEGWWSVFDEFYETYLKLCR